MPIRSRSHAVTFGGAGLALIAAAACSSPSAEDADTTSGANLTIVVGFYPLEFVADRVAGDLANVTTLTAPGVEPHDVELSPQAVASVGEADVTLYSSGLQAAVDEAAHEQADSRALNVNKAADLIATGESSDLDPHFWFDPLRLSEVADLVAGRLADLDPANAATYEGNAADLAAELAQVHEDFAQGLADCQQSDLVTTHSAFGYIADDYGFTQVGITGLSPEAQPSPARLAEVTRIVEQAGVSTIYSEVIVGSDTAQTIAAETGADVQVLDPIEGISEQSAGTDYLEVMQANLQTLRAGQECS